MIWILLNIQQLVSGEHFLLPGSDGNIRISALSIYWGMNLLATIYGVFISTNRGRGMMNLFGQINSGAICKGF
jgi:hypothetical protein